MTAKGHANLLLLLPAVSTVLGWTYLVNDEKVSAIGRYIREHLTPALDKDKKVFGWESAHRSDSRCKQRKIVQVVTDLGTLSAPPVTAIVIYWVNGPYYWPLAMISIVELLVVLGLAFEIVRYADPGV